jgi:hypothetical protein
MGTRKWLAIRRMTKTAYSLVCVEGWFAAVEGCLAAVEKKNWHGDGVSWTWLVVSWMYFLGKVIRSRVWIFEREKKVLG